MNHVLGCPLFRQCHACVRISRSNPDPEKMTKMFTFAEVIFALETRSRRTIAIHSSAANDVDRVAIARRRLQLELILPEICDAAPFFSAFFSLKLDSKFTHCILC